MVQNQTAQKQEKLETVTMYQWRANRREIERRTESVNRELLHRQHAN